MGGTTRVLWTRGTLAVNGSEGSFHFSPEFQVAELLFCEALGFSHRIKTSS